MSRHVGLVATLLSIATVLACTPSADPSRRDLTVFAAASLRIALEASGPGYEAGHPGIVLVYAFDSSSALRTQIEQGALADVFASADTANAETLVEGGYARGAAMPFARNRVVLVVPYDDPAGIGTPADLARPGVRIVAAGTEVPITKYADEVVRRLAALPAYPEGFADAVEANIVSREDNVAAIVHKIELGEGDAGFVYATDALSAENVGIVAIPAQAEVVATYAAVTLRGSPSPDDADGYMAWLIGPDGQSSLERSGFLGLP